MFLTVLLTLFVWTVLDIYSNMNKNYPVFLKKRSLMKERQLLLFVKGDLKIYYLFSNHITAHMVHVANVLKAMGEA